MNKLFIAFFCVVGLMSNVEAKHLKCKKKSKCQATCHSKNTDSVATALFSSKVDTVSYFIGTQIGSDMLKNGVNDINTQLFREGMQDALNALPPKIDPQIAMAYTQAFFAEKQAAKQALEAAKAKHFLDSIAANPNVKTTASGLKYLVIKDSIGEKPTASDKVTVHYTGKLTNGDVFDSSVERGEPATFPLNAVIRGWTEGVQLMSVGSKYTFFIPGNLGYGEQGVPQAGIGPNETLIFDVELLKIEKPAPQVPQAPGNMMIEGQ
ncbi:MAG TPA: FKBP-type peptidyl-prolyl cis-trans isomerase [Chitinophagales bacterium]|nr:FKBP-type peptidyl-prolyl cis-trans isomerase [Chitinophagales bacterium]HQW78282.1 FKBP-type peptidyl-prolyl cis-trans isomerase [Chitinophagales bacterium]HRB18476.1 FKBP-type peptidyl-prolyl cis-trans isomerase [Chitinophagales bacterium]HRB67681.1 FKBP-type peptidyl-prolyl cis-trans isomerase [Chitinophagales bacterium]HRB68544.1 FKBP-type peptidyl-prolyl cis-trans isomerase [Chitinophagales bacterium]